MLLAIVLALVLFLLTCLFHITALNRAIAPFGNYPEPSIYAVLLFLFAVLVSHLIVAGIFAAGFVMGQGLGLGSLDKEPSMQAMDFFYFSLINITTLGLGDIYPTQHLRFVAGVESLTGFLLISCSASYVFKLLRPKQPSRDNANLKEGMGS
ncbi:potassium channel family protein [Pacificimonas flava]|uniref:potassium channel family protein n=1 Tax=Pacificimonas flava TaxID=1234595 RepID=UPI00057177EA|nr:potassium channel family protein [Pacificimonas flava]